VTSAGRPIVRTLMGIMRPVRPRNSLNRVETMQPVGIHDP